MKKFRSLISISLIAVFLTGILLLGTAATQVSSPKGWPNLSAISNPDEATVSDIKALVDRYYWETGEAAGTFDVSKFPTLFTDDPNVSLNKDQAAFLAKAGIQPNGFLTFELARYGEWKNGTEKLDKVIAQRKAEGRQLTTEDLKNLMGPNGLTPARRQEAVKKTEVIFKSFLLDKSGTNALVRFDDHAATYDFFFIKIQDGWRIAGSNLIEAHV